MAISDSDISGALSAYLERYPEEAAQLSEPMRLLRQGENLASRRTFPMHVTVGALLVRNDTEILLIEHLAYGITLQPGGHLEPTDTTLIDAAVRELAEETGLDPGKVFPASQTLSTSSTAKCRLDRQKTSQSTTTSTSGTPSRLRRPTSETFKSPK